LIVDDSIEITVFFNMGRSNESVDIFKQGFELA